MSDIAIGIDIGSSQVRGMTADKKAVVANVAGRATDFIARNSWGDEWIVGDRALEEGRALKVITPVKGGLIDVERKDEAVIALKKIMEHILFLLEIPEEIKPRAIIGVSPLAMRTQRELFLDTLQELFSQVVLAPSTFLAGYAEGIYKRSLVIDLGDGTVDITALYGAIPSPEDHVVTRLGGSYLDERILELFKNEYPDIPCSLKMARNWKEQYASFEEKAIEVEVLTLDGPRMVNIGPVLMRALEEFMPRLHKAIKQLLEGLAPDEWPKYLQNIYLTGRLSRINGLTDRLASDLRYLKEVKVKRVSSPQFAVAMGGMLLTEEFASFAGQ